MPVVDTLPDDTMFRWRKVAKDSIRRLAWMEGDRVERVRLLRDIERDAGDLAGILEAPVHWRGKEAAQ